MSWMRRRLRTVVVAWLVCQVAAVSALPLRDCCGGHEHAKAAGPSCHEAKADAAPEHCPMKATNGAACPMHQTPSPRKPCVMTGACDSQMAMLATLFLVPGVVPDNVIATTVDAMTMASLVPATARLSRPAPPDPPPPRAALAI